MKRSYAERLIAAKRVKLWEAYLDQWGRGGPTSKWTSPGWFRKKKPFDCGNSGCPMCHSDKRPKRHKTRQEKLAELRQLDE